MFHLLFKYFSTNACIPQSGEELREEGGDSNHCYYYIEQNADSD